MFKLPDLGYAFDALEPYIDAKTMEIHHDKHHGAYVEKLNAAVEKYPDLQKKTVEEILKVRDEIQTSEFLCSGNYFCRDCEMKMFCEVKN